jgi:sec-independent protein translocase protein TatC
VLLVRVGIVTADGLRSKRRYAIVICFVVAAVLAPPDVISQIALALPLLAFYEISILVGSWIEKKREEEDKKAEEKDEESSGS